MNIPSFHLPFILWLIGNTLLSAIIVKITARIGIMDKPNERSSHRIPIPKGGGIGIISAFLTGSISIFCLFHQPISFPVLALLIISLFLSIFSWMDDLKQWPALIKLLMQSIAALTLCLCIPSFSFFQQTSYFLFPIVFIWFVYVTNAFNFMDGLNGLAAGVAAISCIFFYSYEPELQSGLIALALLTGLMGFLPFNYPKAEIFMGDVGSQACGLILASFAIFPLTFTASFHTPLFFPTGSILMFFLLFGMLYDVTFTLIRRIKNRDPFLQAHRSHLYQMAHRSHMPAYLVTLIQWSFCIWGGILIYLFPFTNGENMILAFTLLLLPQIIWTLYVIYRTRCLGIKKW